MDIVEHNKHVYNTIAAHFSETRSWVTEDLVELGQSVKDGDKVLDVACGNARLYQLFVEQGRVDGISYTGVDFSEELLNMARKRFPDIDVRLGEMQKLPFADNSFDIVFCLAAFHHLPKDENRLIALKEMARVLKSGGVVIMTNWHLYSDWAKEKLEAGKWKLGGTNTECIVPWKDADKNVIGERYYYAYTPELLEQWCKQAGFKIEKQYFSAKKGSAGPDDGMNIVTIARFLPD